MKRKIKSMCSYIKIVKQENSEKIYEIYWNERKEWEENMK